MIVASTSLSTVDISSSHQNIGKYISIYEDPTASMELSNIRKLPKESFKPLGKPVSSHGFTNASIWYKFDVLNSKLSAIPQLIMFKPSWLDHVEVSIVSPEGKVQTYQGGDRVQYTQRTLEHYLINFRHTFETGVSSVYIKVQTKDPFIVSIALMDEHTFLLENTFYTLLIGLFYGGMIALLIYNLFLYFGIKKHYYLFYVFYLFSFLMVNAAYNGYLFKYIFSEFPAIQNWSQSILSYVFIIASLLFATSFLNLKKYQPKLFRYVRYFIYSILLLFILSALFGGYHYNIIFGIISVMLGSILIALIAFYVWIKGNRSARFFLLGSMSGFIGVTITALTLMSAIPYTYYTYKASDFGMYLDIILLSLALADKYKIMQEDKLKAERDANTDALTGLKNRRSFYEICALEFKKLKRYQNNFSIIVLDVDDFKEVNDAHGHAIGDLLLKQIAFSITDTIRTYDYAFRMGGDEFIILLPETKEEDAYALAKRLLEKINSIYLKPTETQHITASMGISSCQVEDEGIHDAIKRADSALYQVKFTEKNNIKIWENEKMSHK